MLHIIPFQRPFSGKVTVPGSKSITNRILPLAALSGQKIKIEQALRSEDTNVMIAALREFGTHIKILPGKGSNYEEIIIQGEKGFFPAEGEKKLFCQNSGTSFRFLTALAALRKGDTKLTGMVRLRERPIEDLVIALEQLNVSIEYLENEGHAPLEVRGKGSVSGGNIEISGALSSQFLTALLLLAPFAEEDISLHISDTLVSRPYVDITIGLLAQCGIEVQEKKNGKDFMLSAHQEFSLKSEQYFVEGDATAATYPLAIATITGGQATVQNIPKDSLQGDAAFAHTVLKKMGAEVKMTEEGIAVQGPKELKPLGTIDLEAMPDAAMTAVVLAARAKGKSKITGLSTLRHKECDRIEALTTNLQNMGATVEADDDSITIEGDPTALKGAEINTHYDHRVAMCFSVLGSVVPGMGIMNEECVEKTYPTYWQDYEDWRRS